MAMAAPDGQTMSDAFLKVWLQGGPADDWTYYTLVEPPARLYVIPHPSLEGEWIHVLDDGWPQAIAYERAAAVEQFNGERIYYPVER